MPVFVADSISKASIVASFVLMLLGIIFRDLMRFAFNTLAPKPKEGESLGNPVYRWLVNINDILR